MSAAIVNALSFDVEDYYQVEGFADVVPQEEWGRYPSRVAANTRRILDLLEDWQTHATFFVLGWTAERFPEIVREIADRGHELATHGYWHRPVFRQTPDEFSKDLADSIRAIRSALPHGQSAIFGYRAPTFSITGETLWALDVLKEHGIAYDSSIFPLAAHDRYGISESPRFAHLRGGIWEFPIATARVAGRNIPIGGGGYFRLLPLGLTVRGFRRVNAEGQPVVFYLHPWELDPEQPAIRGASRANRMRHYLNIGRTEQKLAALLKRFLFAPIREVFADRLEESLCESR